MSIKADFDFVARFLETLAIENKTGVVTHTADLRAAWAAGTGAGKVDQLFTDRRTLGATTSESLDMRGATLKDTFGNNLDIAKLKVAIIVNRSQVAGEVLHVGPKSVVNAFAGFWASATDANIVGPSLPGQFPGYLVLCSPVGLTVTAGTGDLFVVENPGATPIDYDVFLLGATA